MAVFQPPPTWAEPVVVDERTKKSSFSPVWLKWFVDLVSVINESGGGGGTINHNDTGGLQGGTTNQYYHNTAIQQALISIIMVGGLRPPTDAGAAQVVTKLYAGNGVPSNANGANGDFYFRGDGAAGTFIYHRAAGSWAAFA